MAWRSITEDDLFSGMNVREIEAVREVALAEGQVDPITTVIGQVTKDIRESIRSCPDNRLHPDASLVPDATILHAVPVIRQRLTTRFGSLLDSSEDRTAEYKTAVRYFEAVAACKRSVERFGADESAPAPQVGPHISARGRRFRREDQDGI